MSRHLSVVAPSDSPAGRLHRAYNGTDRLGGIAAVEELRGDLEARQVELVVAARGAGVTWEAIGAAIATTRQGAFNRFGALVQRYEVAGLLGQVAEDTDLVLDAEEARARSATMIEGLAPARPGRSRPAGTSSDKRAEQP